MTPILKQYKWRCVICGHQSKSYHPVSAFQDHYETHHYDNPKIRQANPVDLDLQEGQ